MTRSVVRIEVCGTYAIRSFTRGELHHTWKLTKPPIRHPTTYQDTALHLRRITGCSCLFPFAGTSNADVAAYLARLHVPRVPDFPPIVHAAGHSKYDTTTQMEYYHEAGFDAYMTAVVFTRLLHLHQ